jgi:hypothetical protein
MMTGDCYESVFPFPGRSTGLQDSLLFLTILSFSHLAIAKPGVTSEPDDTCISELGKCIRIILPF